MVKDGRSTLGFALGTEFLLHVVRQSRKLYDICTYMNNNVLTTEIGELLMTNIVYIHCNYEQVTLVHKQNIRFKTIMS